MELGPLTKNWGQTDRQKTLDIEVGAPPKKSQSRTRPLLNFSRSLALGLVSNYWSCPLQTDDFQNCFVAVASI